MATFRVFKESGRFVTVHKDFIHDDNLSWKAKGILLYLLSRPDDWQVYETEIVKHSSDGLSGLKSGIKELEQVGYIHRNRKRDDKGRLKEYEYLVYEQPNHIRFSNVGKTNVGNSYIGKTNVGESHTTNNNSTNNDLTNNNNTNNDDNTSATDVTREQFEEWWNLYDKKKDKKLSYPKFKKCLKDHSFDQIMSGTRAYVKTIKDKQYQKDPKTFLNNQSYMNEYIDGSNKSNDNPYANLF
ncbi:helix-turn-helix domain-containing protein [Staphylococcus gallinarum]|nr:replication protein [Staphylococcus gallinarum]MEB6277523.1 helix-turn-helix domain-containing protein [Staphylococcus gallinarum]